MKKKLKAHREKAASKKSSIKVLISVLIAIPVLLIATTFAFHIYLVGGLNNYYLNSLPAPKFEDLGEQRKIAISRLNDSFQPIEDTALGLNFFSEASHDKCASGQNNGKVNDGYAYQCQYKLTKFYGFSGDFATRMLKVEESLEQNGWQPQGSSAMKNILSEYFLTPSQVGGVDEKRAVESIPKPIYMNSSLSSELNTEMHMGLKLDYTQAKSIPDYSQMSLYGGEIPGADKRNFIDTESTTRSILSQYEYALAVEMSIVYHEVK